MTRVRIVTPWVGDGSSIEAARRPALADDYALKSWSDVTGQAAEQLTPDPNAYTIEVVCEDAVVDQIEADGVYPVLWREAA